MAARVRVTRVAAILSATQIEVEEASIESGAFAYGRLRWIGGRNGGLESALFSSDGVRLILREEPPFPAEAGDLVEISEGCDRSFATCDGRFGNAENFRGEPHLPGMDLLTRYAGA